MKSLSSQWTLQLQAVRNWTRRNHLGPGPSLSPGGGALKRNPKPKSMCVTYFLPGPKLSRSCAAVESSAPLQQPSPLVMWVHYRGRLILPSLVSPSVTSPWTGINAIPSLGSQHDLNASPRTGTVWEGQGSVRWAWARIPRSVLVSYTFHWCRVYITLYWVYAGLKSSAKYW